jgi:predicted CoA-binding protein
MFRLAGRNLMKKNVMNNDIGEKIRKAKVIAVIGCSKNKYRTSCQIASYLQDAGYKIIPIHPDYEEVLGEKTYASIIDVPEEIQVDIVDIFRNSKYTAAMVNEIVEWSKATGQKPLVWTQLGVSSDEAKKKAREAGLDYVEEKCLMVEHKRLE